MGSVKRYLCKIDLPDREKHNSRMFVDLAENIHIHYREYRLIFSLDEYFEFSDILNKSTNDVRSFLIQNPDYKEQAYPTTLMIAGGKDRQLKFLSNSLQPNKSCYFNNIFDVELQDEFVTDEIHLHYRDFRIVMNRSNFRIMAHGFSEALSSLDDFEKHNTYIREMHSDRLITNYNKQQKDNIETQLMGAKKVDLDKIYSFWYEDVSTHFKPQKGIIDILKKEYLNTGSFFPIILSTEKDGKHFIIDGHHRYYTALELKTKKIDAIITDLAFDETEELRQVEGLLKAFDRKTNYKYNFSEFLKQFIAYKNNSYYKNIFGKMVTRNSFPVNFLRKIKRIIYGKRNIFRSFNEPDNESPKS